MKVMLQFLFLLLPAFIIKGNEENLSLKQSFLHLAYNLDFENLKNMLSEQGRSLASITDQDIENDFSVIKGNALHFSYLGIMQPLLRSKQHHKKSFTFKIQKINKSFNIIKLLLYNSDIDPNTRGTMGQTVLHHILREKLVQPVNYLSGLSIKSRDFLCLRLFEMSAQPNGFDWPSNAVNLTTEDINLVFSIFDAAAIEYQDEFWNMLMSSYYLRNLEGLNYEISDIYSTSKSKGFPKFSKIFSSSDEGFTEAKKAAKIMINFLLVEYHAWRNSQIIQMLLARGATDLLLDDEGFKPSDRINNDTHPRIDKEIAEIQKNTDLFLLDPEKFENLMEEKIDFNAVVKIKGFSNRIEYFGDFVSEVPLWHFIVYFGDKNMLEKVLPKVRVLDLSIKNKRYHIINFLLGEISNIDKDILTCIFNKFHNDFELKSLYRDLNYQSVCSRFNMGINEIYEKNHIKLLTSVLSLENEEDKSTRAIELADLIEREMMRRETQEALSKN